MPDERPEAVLAMANINNGDFPAKNSGPDALLHRPDKSWIVPTGGGYYFAPSVFALKLVLSR